MPAIFNQILILDSIPEGELNTTRRLHEDVTVLAQVVGEAPAIVSLRVESSGHFYSVIEQCAELARPDPYVPLVHLECHGSENGVQFADGSRATWTHIKQALTPLNIATKLNLITVISACNGSALAGTVKVTERAPVRGFIGPNHAMGAFELETAFSAFYRTLLMTQSSEEAAQAMRTTANDGTFMVMSSETIFAVVLAGYRERFEGRDAILRRAHDLQERALERGVFRQVDEIVAMLQDPEIVETFRRTFFMIDLYPEHEDRFPIRG